MLFALCLPFAMIGCALQGGHGRLPSDPALPEQPLLIDVPFFAQKAYQCGPAALAMVLQASGIVVTPDELVAMVYLPDRKGSLQSSLIGGARRHGRLAYPITGLACLMRELAAGHAVVVLQNLGLNWLPRWHYAVAVGFDPQARQMILHTGTVAHRRVGISTFERTWRRAQSWGLVVLAAGYLPACAEEPDYLKAALGLQQAGKSAEARQAFQAAVDRWPDSFNAHMALGNSQYAAAELENAARSFRTAAALNPESGDALNNLAHVLAEMGDWGEALRMIRLALDLAGPNRPTYLQTMDEIRKRMEPRDQNPGAADQ